jgi:hypothetical protein
MFCAPEQDFFVFLIQSTQSHFIFLPNCGTSGRTYDDIFQALVVGGAVLLPNPFLDPTALTAQP